MIGIPSIARQMVFGMDQSCNENTNNHDGILASEPSFGDDTGQRYAIVTPRPANVAAATARDARKLSAWNTTTGRNDATNAAPAIITNGSSDSPDDETFPCLSSRETIQRSMSQSIQRAFLQPYSTTTSSWRRQLHRPPLPDVRTTSAGNSSSPWVFPPVREASLFSPSLLLHERRGKSCLPIASS